MGAVGKWQREVVNVVRVCSSCFDIELRVGVGMVTLSQPASYCDSALRDSLLDGL